MSEQADYARLSVNINDESAAILRKVKAERGLSTTEATRIALGLLGFWHDMRNQHKRIFTEDRHGERLEILDGPGWC